jgi:hypothetical protein
MKLHMPHFSGRLICISDSVMFSTEINTKTCFIPVTKIVVEEKVIKMVTRPHDSICSVNLIFPWGYIVTVPV